MIALLLPRCGEPAATRIEGYSPKDGRMTGSLDVAAYACAEHFRSAWEAVVQQGMSPYSPQGTPGETIRCGDVFDYTIPRLVRAGVGIEEEQ